MRQTWMLALIATAALASIGSACPGAESANPEAAGAQRWLIIGAHPDDEAKAVPLILKQRKPGDAVVVMIMRLCGEGPPSDRASWTRQEAVAVRSGEMQEAAKFLNAELRWWLPPHPANANIARTPETVAKMVALLKEIKPTRIVANWPEDFHPDHVGTGETVREAVKQLRIAGGMPVYFFGTPGRPHAQKNFVPNHFVDISDALVLASVIWARAVHRSQTNFYVIRTHLGYYREHGRKLGVEYAAGYVLQRL